MPDSESKRHILIMEDEAVIRGLLVKTLDRHGFRVTETADGAGVLETYGSLLRAGTPPDLVILDLIVPAGMGGKEALRELRKIAPEVKVIIASGYSDEAELEKLREEGRTEILNKPYDIRRLINSVNAMSAPPGGPVDGSPHADRRAPDR